MKFHVQKIANKYRVVAEHPVIGKRLLTEGDDTQKEMCIAYAHGAADAYNLALQVVGSANVFIDPSAH